MNPPRRWLTFRRSVVPVMAAVAALALAAAWLAPPDIPHALRCWDLLRRQHKMASINSKLATRYQFCMMTVPCAPSQYCGNACLPHNSPGASQQERSRAADAHERAAADYEHAAELHARFAHELRQAAYNPSQPIPSQPEETEAIDYVLGRRYQCDTF